MRFLLVLLKIGVPLAFSLLIFALFGKSEFRDLLLIWAFAFTFGWFWLIDQVIEEVKEAEKINERIKDE